MVEQKLVGVSWNIGGAQVVDWKSESTKRWANRGEDIRYVGQTLRELGPDFVTLQESHTRDERTKTGPRRLLAEEIASDLDMHYVDHPVSPSHIDEMSLDDPGKYWLSLSVLSKTEPISATYIPFPQPDFPIYFPGTNEIIPEKQRHEKGVLITELENGLHVVSAQALPARILGFDYAEGARFTEDINNVLDKLPKAGTIFLGFDANYDERWGYDGRLNHPPVTDVFTALPLRGMMSIFPREEPALPVRKGRPEEKQGSVKTDYVFLSGGSKMISADVVKKTAAGPIQVDHYPLKVVFQRSA